MTNFYKYQDNGGNNKFELKPIGENAGKQHFKHYENYDIIFEDKDNEYKIKETKKFDTRRVDV